MDNIHACVLDSVGKSFRKKVVLDDCSVQIPAGATVALVGSNGAGKSTLMSLIAGVLEPTTGSITVDGDRVTPGIIPSSLSYLTQDRPLYRSFTVDEMVRAARALNDRWDDAYCQELITNAGIDGTSRIRSLSGGQRSRVALALTLARRPSLLLLDEPVSDLDPLARRDVRDLLMAETSANKTTTIISSHIVTELADHCDHLLLLAQGRILCFTPIDDILAADDTSKDRSKVLEEFVLSRLTEGVPA